ncbi:MAG TPA: VWA domain-containing protein [Pyrinomonadaceae bacterium]
MALKNNRRLISALILVMVVACLIQTTSQNSGAQKNARTQKQTKPNSATDELGQAPPIPKLKPKKEEPQKDPEVSPGDVISVTTSEVMIPVTVRDSEGRLVNDLTRSDFRVFEDGTQQPLSDLALRQVPVDVALMVDASSSVASNIEDFRVAAEGFAKRLADDDRISLIKFDDRVELLLDWTKSRYQLHRALNRIDAGMFTRFNDALLLASRDQFSPAGKSRKAVIVLTDGIDHGSSTSSLETALHALLQAQVTVYVVSNTQISRAEKVTELDMLTNSTAARFNQLKIDDLRERIQALDQSEDSLAQLTAATGGRLFKPLTFNALESTYAEVADELRHQYALYYTPVNKSRDGAFRRVKVETANPGYKSQTRVGYFAPKD